MSGWILNNLNPSKPFIEYGNGEKKDFDNFDQALEFADQLTEKRFPRWPEDQTSFPFLEAFDEARTDRIAASHGDGEHYRVGDEWLREDGLLEEGQ